MIVRKWHLSYKSLQWIYKITSGRSQIRKKNRLQFLAAAFTAGAASLAFQPKMLFDFSANNKALLSNIGSSVVTIGRVTANRQQFDEIKSKYAYTYLYIYKLQYSALK